ncbi:restriction endonuclease [Saccharopolyspora sp. NPDC002686]|uniref:McrC family protein n=1 Tax=Saccharopolyspora sp. NPDC002686 TaxID=3154541 RepID=UPI00331C8C0D
MITSTRLGENERNGVPAVLDAAQAHALRATGLVMPVLQPDGTWLLLPRGRVGAVSIDGVDVVVTPKVGIARLLFLLGYARNPGFRSEDVPGSIDDGLWPAVAESLCRHVERATSRGVLQGYVTEDATLTVVRGRIRIADQAAKRPGMLLPLEVRHDEYSTDIAENRLLHAAVRRVLGLPRIAEEVRMRLKHLDVRLDGAAPLLPGAPLPQWRPSRLNVDYQPALRLAELVLHNLSFETGPGGLNVASFVVDMAEVFEDFVTTALTEAWRGRPGTTIAQHTAALDTDGAVRIHPDVVHVVGGVPRIVADAKYKLASPTGRHPNADHYQMLAYCTALGVDTAWLVYASGEDHRPRRVVNSPITIIEHPLDLAAPPAELLQQVAQLAETAWQRSSGT